MDIVISIIIPIYNSETYLKKGLESCINQTLENIEIICVDDMSTDNSWQLIEEYQKKYSDKIIAIRLEQKSGQGGARNAGIKAARGQYICFMDSDDYLDCHLCEDAYKVLREDDADLVYFDYYRVTKDNIFPVQLISEEDIPYWYHNLGCAVWLQIIKKSILLDYELYSPKLIRAADDAITPLWKYYAKKKIKLNRPYYYYVYRGDSLVNNTSYDRVVAPIKDVIPFRNNEFIKRNIYNNLKAEIDVLMANDIVATLRRLFRLRLDVNSLDMQKLRKSIGLSNDYKLNDTLINYSLTAGDKEYLEYFFYRSDEMNNSLLNYEKYIEIIYEKGLTKAAEYIVIEWLNEHTAYSEQKCAIWGVNQMGIALYSSLQRRGIESYLFDSNKDSIFLGNELVEIYKEKDLAIKSINISFVPSIEYFEQINKQINNVMPNIKVINVVDLIKHGVKK